jgi:two-component system OmpR family response regulator
MTMPTPKHILVVDDDGDVRDVIISVLQDQNYRVSCAADGASMRSVLKYSDPVDCVVLDAVLPGEKGISLMLHLKEMGIRVVMISGHPEAMQYAAANNLQLLRKPFHIQEICDAITEALASTESGQRVA